MTLFITINLWIFCCILVIALVIGMVTGVAAGYSLRQGHRDHQTEIARLRADVARKNSLLQQVADRLQTFRHTIDEIERQPVREIPHLALDPDGNLVEHR